MKKTLTTIGRFVVIIIPMAILLGVLKAIGVWPQMTFVQFMCVFFFFKLFLHLFEWADQ